MVQLVNFGSLVTIGGKTVTSGSASGLDTESLINSLVDAKSIPLNKNEDSITLKTSQSSALSQYKLLLSNFQSAVDFLRNPPGVSKDASNIFQYRTAFISASDGSSASNYLGVSVEAGATVGSYDIIVDNLAKAATNTSISFASKSDALATADGSGGTPKAGTFSLNGIDVTIAVGDTLEQIRTKINATTTTSGVKADVIKVSDSEYKLKITATTTGEDNDYTVAGDTTVFNSMFTGVGATSQLAENATVFLNGLEVERQTNSFDDLIDGVTFTLYQESAATMRVDVDPARTQASEAIGNFVDTYNAVKQFIAQQQARDEDGKLLEGAVLGENTLLNNFATVANSELNAIVDGLTGDFDSLATLGITFTDYAGDDENPPIKNLLQLDEAKLASALEADFDGVRSVFEFQFTTSAPDRLAVFSRTNAFNVSDFQFDIDFSRALADQVRVIYTDSLGAQQTINADITVGSVLSAQSGAIGDGIFSATDEDDVFAGLVDGDNFRITLTNIDGTTTDFDFTYQTTPVAATDFNSLSTLKDAIEATAGLKGKIVNGRLVVTPESQLSKMTFTNLTVTDFKGEFGFSNTKFPTATITGQENTVMEGLTFVYATTTDTDLIDVTLTQGIADRLYNITSQYTLANDGLLDKEVGSLATQKEKLQSESVRLQQVIETYRERLLVQFSALERAISSVNSILQLLDAQAKARENA